jgi:hypothetical protein
VVRAVDDDTRPIAIASDRLFREKRSDSLVCLPGPLHLRHVPAVQLDVTGLRESLGDVPRERDRHQRVVATPDEQGICWSPRNLGQKPSLPWGASR